MVDIFNRISAELTVPPSLIKTALELAYSRYKRIVIPKRSGGVRTMIQPAAELKLIQAWLLKRVFYTLPVSSIATAFEVGTSIVKNAQVHRHSNYSIRLDLTDFFPSIRFEDLLIAMAKNKSILPVWSFEPDTMNMIKNACFDADGRLPIGYLSSPHIANMVMYDFDELLNIKITSNTQRFGNCFLTRYADDFVFSTDRRGGCRQFLDLMRETLPKVESPKLRLNDRKTRFMSRAGGSTLITGLRVNNLGEVGVHANYRDHVRLLLKLYANKKLKAEDVQKLRGHLAFVEHADPGLYTRLSYKYFSEISALSGTSSLQPQ